MKILLPFSIKIKYESIKIVFVGLSQSTLLNPSMGPKLRYKPHKIITFVITSGINFFVLGDETHHQIELLYFLDIYLLLYLTMKANQEKRKLF